jgi:hypothetical protein
MPRKTHQHWPSDHPAVEQAPWCTFPTKKLCEDNFANWQADHQVELAERVVREGRAKQYRRVTDLFSQVVRVVNGDQPEIVGGSAWARRLQAALERRKEYTE